MSDTLVLLILGIVNGILLIAIYEGFLWCKEKYTKYNIFKNSDKRKFNVHDVVWFNGHKFYIVNINISSHSLNIDLRLRPIDYDLSFLETNVDSREVKKVIKTYAGLNK